MGLYYLMNGFFILINALIYSNKGVHIMFDHLNLSIHGNSSLLHSVQKSFVISSVKLLMPFDMR